MESVGASSGNVYILDYTIKQITELIGPPSDTLYILGYIF